jgi:hypothetical protein
MMAHVQVRQLCSDEATAGCPAIEVAIAFAIGAVVVVATADARRAPSVIPS